MGGKRTLSYKNIVCLIGIAVSVFAVNMWVLRKNFYFLFDDIAWIYHVKYQIDIKNLLHILPTSRYNDRPIRTLFFLICYQLFGLDYTSYYLIILLWHVLNTFLLLKLAYMVLKNVNFAKAFECACICAMFFGLYPKNLMAVFWIAGAANDLLCTSFSLISMIVYLKYMKNRKSWCLISLALIFYILAMRSKEASICLPIILMIYELYMAYYNKQKFRLYSGNMILTGYMLLYLIRIFTLPVGLTGSGQYEQNFSPVIILEVLLNYIRMYFGLDDPSFSYKIGHQYSTKIGDIGIIIMTAIVVVAFTKIFYKKGAQRAWGIIALAVSIGAALGPLLVLPNIQHLLYFYFPAVFISILFGVILFQGLDLLRYKIRYIQPCVFVLAVLLLINNIGGAKKLRESWMRWGMEALSATQEIIDIEPIPAGYHVYLQGASEGANVFNYGPGYIVNILYNEPDISVELINEDTDYQIPYAVWNYSAGQVQEIERVEE